MSTLTLSKDPLIYDPNQPARRGVHTFHGVLTLLAWLAYAYLWLPVITVIAWMLGLRTSYVQLYVQSYEFDRDVFGILFLLAIIATALLIGWAEYNRHKFAGKDRRIPQTDVDVDDVAAFMLAPAALGRQLAGAKRIVLSMDAHGRPLAASETAALA